MLVTPSEPTPAEAAGVESATRFAERIARRDEPPQPEPLRFDAHSVQQRLQKALRRQIPGLSAPRRTLVAQLCYRFLDSPVLDSQAEADTGVRSPRSASHDWQQLVETGLVERLHAGRQRRYRLTRTGEDWLLAVVQGTLPV